MPEDEEVNQFLEESLNCLLEISASIKELALSLSEITRLLDDAVSKIEDEDDLH